MAQPNFYRDLAFIPSFSAVTDKKEYRPLPNGWVCIVADIKGSTRAIEAGKYKEVNTIGAATIVATLTAAGETDIPFVFGGDGASFAVPTEIMPAVKNALLGTQMLAKGSFNMELRVGIVPIEDIRARGGEVLLGKVYVNKFYHQASFRAGGLALAESLIKDEATAALYALNPTGLTPTKDFNLLTCRWHDVESKHGETVAIIVKALGDETEQEATYREAIARIEEAYGEEMSHPVTVDRLHLLTNPAELDLETRVRAGDHGALWRELRRVYLALGLTFFDVMKKLGVHWKDLDLALYKEIMVATCDYRKFDDTLRMVLAGTSKAREKLLQHLARLHAQGRIVYGVHTTNRALMTCLVFERYGRQVHFIDAADGGYTMAAKQMKAQLKARTYDTPSTT